MEAELLGILPVLPSKDIERDVKWYAEYIGFKPIHQDERYAVLQRHNCFNHLQWHANTKDDPLLGGSVIRIAVKQISRIFKEFVARGTVNKDKLKLNTVWNTNEFGFYDLNKNAIFIVEHL
jgi:hypothetical protein